MPTRGGAHDAPEESVAVVVAWELKQLAAWSEEPTSAGAIAGALAGIWQEAARGADAEPEDPSSTATSILRTRVVNLVAYAASATVMNRATAALTHLAGTHPGRSILLLAQPGRADSSLGASLQAFCHTAGPDVHRLCCDQIAITARGSSAQHLPGIVTRLLIPDLPTLLWWPGNPPTDAPAFAAMTDVCDVLAVDSAGFRDARAGLQALARFARSRRGRPAVADLNWDRLNEWRDIVAQFFDAREQRPYLQAIRKAEVDVAAASGAGASAQALLLVGWLASRLGWESLGADVSSGSTTLHFSSGSQPVVVRLIAAQEKHAGRGAVTGLRLESVFEGRLRRFAVDASGPGSHGTTTADLEGGGSVTRGFSMQRPTERALLGEEVEAVGVDCALGEALDAAAAIAAHLQG